MWLIICVIVFVLLIAVSQENNFSNKQKKEITNISTQLNQEEMIMLNEICDSLGYNRNNIGRSNTIRDLIKQKNKEIKKSPYR